MNTIFRGLSDAIYVSLFIVFAAAGGVSAQPSADQTPAATNSIPEQIEALQLQLTNAWHQVETIVNQPPRTYRYDSSYSVSIYSPGWFHPGAITPDFNTVDVRQSQQLTYTSPWVSSDITPTMMWRGSDLEFNAMTKLFYTNRSLPKKKLSEAEMLQINSLYRTIGHCQGAIQQLQNPPAAETVTDTESDTNDNAPQGIIGNIQRVPQQTRILYGGIGIGALLVVMIALRMIRKKPEV